MATVAERELYPFSTSDAKSVPVDIIWPLKFIKKAFIADDETSMSIPADFDIVSIKATADVLIDFGNAATYPIAETAYSSALFVPAETIMTVRLPSTGAVKLVPATAGQAGSLYIQSVQKWAALGLQRQLTNR